MEAFFVATAVVALAEIGDKTQLLSLVLAARYRRPWPIVLGIFAATLLNHALAGAVGTLIVRVVPEHVLAWALALSFVAMALWTLVPDKLDETPEARGALGVFGTTTIAFFLAEMGDKTQVATVMLAAQYPSYLAVVLGTTLGMLLANAPVVFLGDRFANRLPLRAVRIVAALVFAALGVMVAVRALS